jgi:hypothetical protein
VATGVEVDKNVTRTPDYAVQNSHTEFFLMELIDSSESEHWEASNITLPSE